MGIWKTIGGLLENAFFKAILPGFEEQRKCKGREGSATSVEGPIHRRDGASSRRDRLRGLGEEVGLPKPGESLDSPAISPAVRRHG